MKERASFLLIIHRAKASTRLSYSLMLHNLSAIPLLGGAGGG